MGSLTAAPTLVGVGDNVVDCYLHMGEMFPGGNTVNVAVQARRSGIGSAYVGVVGDDEAGRRIRSALSVEQVGLDRLRVVDGSTATALIELVDGDRVFVGSEKGVSFFTLEEQDLDFIAGFGLAHVSYCSGLEEQVPAIAQRAPVSFDFSDRRSPDYVEPLLPHVEIAEFSASDLTDHEVGGFIRWVHGQGPSHVLVTRGSGGAILYDGNDTYTQPALPAHVVDTLGAGDAFVARTLVGLLRAEPIPQLLHAAAAVAASACERYGAFGYGGGLPAGLVLSSNGTTNLPHSRTNSPGPVPVGKDLS